MSASPNRARPNSSFLRRMGIQSRPDLVIIPSSTTPAERSEELRRVRKHQILRLIRDIGPLSRLDISNALEYNYRSVSMLVDELVSEGLAVEEEATQKAGPGRRPVPVRFNPDSAMVIGVEVAEGTTRALMLNLASQVLGRHEAPTPECTAEHEWATWTSDFLREAMTAAGAKMPPLAGVGVCLPGPALLPKGDAVEYLPYEPRSLAGHTYQALAAWLDVPALLESRVRSLALASLWMGEGRECSSYVYLDMKASPATALVLNGQLWRGRDGLAGEDPGSASAVAHAKAALHLLNPDAIIVGGGATAADVDAIRAAIKAEPNPRLAEASVLACSLSADAAALGAACQVYQRIFTISHAELAQLV